MTKKIPLTGLVRHRADIVRPDGYTVQAWNELLITNGLMRFKEGKLELGKPYEMQVVYVAIDEKYYNVIEKHLPEGVTLKDFATACMEDSLDILKKRIAEAERS